MYLVVGLGNPEQEYGKSRHNMGFDAINQIAKNYQISLERKKFDAMMAEKPILYAVNAPNNYIKEYDCGISVEPENVSALKMGIQNMLSLSDEERKNMG